MARALDLAVRAGREGEVPVGCVIVRDGRIVGRGYNRREQTSLATAHAEVLAIEEACRAVGDWRLDRCALYVTLEPCPMCAGAILNARVPEIVFGAADREMGALGGAFHLFYEPVHFSPRIVGGVLEGRCSALLRDFFARRRSK